MALLRALAALLAPIVLAGGATGLETGCSERARPGLPEPARTRLPNDANDASAPKDASANDTADAPNDAPSGQALDAASARPEGAIDASARSAGEATQQMPTRGGGSGRHRYVVAVVGDSLTDARSQGGKYLNVLRERCPQSRFDNYGVGGEMVNQMRRRFARDVLGDPPMAEDPKPKYTHVLVLGGINDICSDESAHRSNRKIEVDLDAMYHTAHEHGIRVVALTMPPWGGFKRYYNARRGASTREINDWIRRQARDGAVDSLLDIYPLLSCGRPSVLCPSYAWPDQVHWNAEGHRIVGEALYGAVFAHCE